MKIDIIVTQHQPLVRYLRELGYATDETPVIEHAAISDISGKHVAGVLPVAMAAHCASYTEIPMAMTPADRAALRQGDLSYERMREICGDPVTYRVAAAWRWEDMRAELGILESLRKIIIAEHTYEAEYKCVRHETIMHSAKRLSDAWEASRPRARVVRRLIERIGHVRASFDATTGGTHLLAENGRQCWLLPDESLATDDDQDRALNHAIAALT